jgi:hypothetical protein
VKRNSILLLAVMALPNPVARVINHDVDDPQPLSPGVRIETNLRSIDASSKRKVPNRYAPWSDVGWKANHGLVAERYNDPNYEQLGGWNEMSQYLSDNSAARILRYDPWSRDQWIRSLSPAEKYDLVLGIASDGLASHIAGFLNETLGSDPEFPSWWGLCEGSAPASVFYPEPTKAVVLHSEAYNLDVPFYAPDIKGLATQLWSRFNTNLDMPEAGTQCKKENEENGMCFDDNPATFHAAVHHFLDTNVSAGYLIADWDPTPVVWNFPFVAYSESYYRVDKGSDKKVDTLAAAAVPVSDWSADPRRSKRSPGTAYLVGVKMDVSYGVNQTQRAPNEGSLKRKINTRTLIYELELDPNYNLLGGEWVAGTHPDLLWSVPKGTVPDSPAESQLPSQGGENGVIPKAWGAAAKASALKLTPLRRVVDILIQRSAH